MIVVEPTSTWRQRWTSARSTRRYSELLGCTTRGASRSNFEQGCGRWLCFYLHPNCPVDGECNERLRRTELSWDCAVGIRYWHQSCSGAVDLIPETEVDAGHFTRMRRKGYVASSVDDWRRDLSKELSTNSPLGQVCGQFGLGDLYERSMCLLAHGR